MNNAPEINKTFKLTGKYHEGIGRRKRAKARVRIYPGHGQYYWNQDPVTQLDAKICQPLEMIAMLDKWDISAKVSGGGSKSQVEAVRLGLSRALIKYDVSLKPTLRKAGFLTRDPREKERKKPGLKRARRAPQWQKR